MWEQLFQIALPAIVSAATVGVPLYIQIRKTNAELKAKNEELELEKRKKAQDIHSTERINTEAEWKRVIEEKKEEITRLRAKDDEQEVKLMDLLNRQIECKQNEARQDERAKFFEKRSEEQAREIKALTNKILQLEKLIREKFNASEYQSSESTGGTGEA